MSQGAAADFRESSPVPTSRLGMWLFLASEVMFFAALIGSYVVLRLGASSWPDPNEVLGVPGRLPAMRPSR